MVKFIKVSKNYGNIQALSDITFHIEDGEFVFLVGPSGAGKTTILKLLIAQTKPSEGEIYLNDLQIHKLKSSKVPALRQKIGMVFQDYKLLQERSVRENIEVALAVKGVARKEWNDRVNQVLKMVGLYARRELFPSQLSGGELQRVSLARALVINPSVILADEPTGNLDWKTAESIMDLFKKVNDEGKTLIVTSHNLGLIEKFGKRIIEIEGGKVVKDSPNHKHKKG